MSSRQYRFPGREPGGVATTPFAPVQIIGAGIAAAIVIAILTTHFSQMGLFVALTAGLALGGTCLMPVQGRTLVEWAPFILHNRRRPSRWRSSATRRGRRMNSHAPTDPSTPPPADPPPGCEGIELHDVAVSDTVSFGVLVDRRNKSWSAAVHCTVGSYELLAADQKEAKLDGFGRLLTGIAREGTPVSAVQWIEGTALSDAHDLVRYYSEHRASDIDLKHSVSRSYLEVLESAPAATQDHSIIVVVQIDLTRASRAIGKMRGKDSMDVGACRVLLQELKGIADALGGIDVDARALRARHLAQVIRESYDPNARRELTRHNILNPADSGVAEHDMWPLDVLEEPGQYRTDGMWHKTLAVTELPADTVGADFLRPLLLESGPIRRRVSTIMRPNPPSRARKDVKDARTTTRGFRLLKARVMDEQVEDVQRDVDLETRAWELQHGHGDYFFASYITVSADTKEQLEEAVYELGQLASRSGNMQLRTDWFNQANAFTYTLPLGRGLA